MLEYFLEYQIGAEFGLANPILFAGYLVLTVLLLNELPKGKIAWLRKIMEICLFWMGMQLLSSVYYAAFRDSYLNQAQQVGAALIYAIFLSKYPIQKRIVMSCAAWSTEILLLGIHGSLGIVFSVPSFLVLLFCLACLYGFFYRFAVDEFLLAPEYTTAVVVVLALSGATSTANWGAGFGFDGYSLFTDCVLLGALLLVYYLVYYINSTYRQNLELMAMQKKQEAESELLRITQKNREEMRLLRHEIKNHDAYIAVLLDQKRYDELEAYIRRDLTHGIHITPQIDSGNCVVDSVVNQKIAAAEAAGVKIQCHLAVPENLPFQEIDLYSLISNLLDNAIEACAGIRNDLPIIAFKIYQNRDYLFIRLENPFDHTKSGEERLKLITSKGDPQYHGYGTKVIRRVAERYGGHVRYHVENGRFVSDVMLAMTKTE